VLHFYKNKNRVIVALAKDFHLSLYTHEKKAYLRAEGLPIFLMRKNLLQKFSIINCYFILSWEKEHLHAPIRGASVVSQEVEEHKNKFILSKESDVSF
jgi:hypothetical protein